MKTGAEYPQLAWEPGREERSPPCKRKVFLGSQADRGNPIQLTKRSIPKRCHSANSHVFHEVNKKNNNNKKMHVFTALVNEES